MPSFFHLSSLQQKTGFIVDLFVPWMIRRILNTEMCVVLQTCICPFAGVWRNCLSRCVALRREALVWWHLSQGWSGRDRVHRAAALPGLGWGSSISHNRLNSSLDGGEEGTAYTSYDCDSWNKEWARGPTVLQSCTVCRQPTLELWQSCNLVHPHLPLTTL